MSSLAAPVTPVFAPVTPVFAAIAHVFAPIAPVFDAVATPAVVLGVPVVLASIASIFAPIAPVFATVSHVFAPIAAVAVRWGAGEGCRRGQERTEHHDRAHQGLDPSHESSSQGRLEALTLVGSKELHPARWDGPSHLASKYRGTS